jgi:hypothetical protein
MFPAIPLALGNPARVALEIAIRCALTAPIANFATTVRSNAQKESGEAGDLDGAAAGKLAEELIANLFGTSDEVGSSMFFDLNTALVRATLAGDLIGQLLEVPEKRTALLQVYGTNGPTTDIQIAIIDRQVLAEIMGKDSRLAGLTEALHAEASQPGKIFDPARAVHDELTAQAASNDSELPAAHPGDSLETHGLNAEGPADAADAPLN